MSFFGKDNIIINCSELDRKFKKEVLSLLKNQNLKINIIMATIAQLQEKVDALQVALDNEQEQIKAAIEELNSTVAELRDLVADGGSAEERQALADKLDAIRADLEATVEGESTTSTTTEDESTTSTTTEEVVDPGEEPSGEDVFA